MDELVASVTGSRFQMRMTETEPTVDGRIFSAGAINFDREPPLPVMLLTEETDGGHNGAQLAGTIDTVRREGSEIVMEGNFDTGSQAGQEAQRLVSEGLLNTWSPTMGNMETDIEMANDQPTMRITSATVLGGTITPYQALSSAKVKIIPDAPMMAEPCTDCMDQMVAAAPLAPPSEWFTDPRLERATPLTVTPEGRIFGHAALFGECHIGRSDVCVTPPNSQTQYAYFRTGSVLCDDGSEVPTGVITLGTGHASLRANGTEAAAHYDNTGTAVADVSMGEDAFGPWVAGAVRPGTSDEQIRILRGSALSGDWRRLGGTLELVALLAVNVPGFPVKAHIAASGQQTALVAAGQTIKSDVEMLERFERLLGPLVPLAAERLRSKLSQIK